MNQVLIEDDVRMDQGLALGVIWVGSRFSDEERLEDAKKEFPQRTPWCMLPRDTDTLECLR